MFRHSLPDLARVASGARLVALQVAKLAEAGQFRSVPVRWEQGLRPPPAGAAAEDAPRPASSVTPVLREETITPVLRPESSEEAVPQGWRADAEHDPSTSPSGFVAEAARQPSPSAHAVQGNVPTSPITRAMHFGGLGLGLAAGAAAAAVRRGAGFQEAEGAAGSLVMTEANVERLASTLCRLRGAALKVGQMLSFNDSVVLPPALQQVIELTLTLTLTVTLALALALALALTLALTLTLTLTLTLPYDSGVEAAARDGGVGHPRVHRRRPAG